MATHSNSGNEAPMPRTSVELTSFQNSENNLEKMARNDEKSGGTSFKEKGTAKLEKLHNFFVASADHPAAKQKTPCGINRYVLLLIYMFYAFLTASPYFGWPPLASMIFKNDGFSTLCPKVGNSDVYADDQRLLGREYICDDQDAEVQKLYTITLCSHFTMSAVAGTLLDFIGPLFTALLGQLFNTIGWATLSLCTTTPALYYPAFIFMGMGADTGVLPTLTINRLFPGSAAHIITLIGSAISASFAIPFILHTIWENHPDTMSYKSTMLTYVGFGPLFCMILIVLFFPLKSFTAPEDFDIKKEQDSLERMERESGKNVSGADVKESNSSPEEKKDRFLGDGMTSIDISSSTPADNNQQSQDVSTEPGDAFAVKVVPFWRQLFSERFFLISFYFIVVNIVAAYYQQAPQRMFNKSVVNTMETLMPLSFLPCILLGKVADIIGIIPVIFIINSCGLLMYVFAVIPSSPVWYISVVLFTVYMCLFTSQVYCYVETTFSAKHFGKLIGICSMLGGVFSLISNPLYHQVTIQANEGNMRPMQIAFICVLAVLFLVPIRMFWIAKKNKSPFENVVERKAADSKGADDFHQTEVAESEPGVQPEDAT